MEELLLKCPNCGASTTNHLNCEYCGSLLVRFVEKGIDLSKTSYLTSKETFPTLALELEHNLKLQKQGEQDKNFVSTDIWHKYKNAGESTFTLSVLRTGYGLWADKTKIDIGNGDIGLCIVLNFATCFDFRAWNYNKIENQRLARFKELDSFPLFTSHHCIFTDEWGNICNGKEYAIDFGTDAEGAARLLSEIFQKVYEVPISEKIKYHTNVGSSIEKCRWKVNEARNFKNLSISQAIIITIVLTIIVTSLVSLFI